MRGIIDASAFSGRSNGPMVLARNLIERWGSDHPEDEIIAWLPAGDDVPPTRRSMTHLTRSRRAFDSCGPLDFYLSVNPTIPFRVPGDVPLGVIVADYRHEDEPANFSLPQRLYRRTLWENGVRRADRVFAISETTRLSLLAKSRTEPTLDEHSVTVIPLGADHAAPVAHTVVQGSHDQSPEALGHGSHVIALCHRENKPAEVAIETWRCARALDPDVLPLVVVGVADDRHADLLDRVGEQDRQDLTIAGRLDQQSFEHTFGSSSAILFLSSGEGFGLPMAEGLQLGIPVIAFELPALREIAGHDYPMAQAGDVAAAAGLLVEGLRRGAPHDHRRLATWTDTVRTLRHALTGEVTE